MDDRASGEGTVRPNHYSSAPLSEAVYMEIRKRILAGLLRPGDRLRETDLAPALGVSRTPVREAIKRLESDGLVNCLPSRGAVVAELTPDQSVELYALRETLEGAAARFAAQHAQETEIILLQALLEKQRGAEHDAATLSRMNRNFHEAIYRAAHNRYLRGAVARAQDYTALLKGSAYFAPGRPQSAYREHLGVVEAIAARDPDAAEAAARYHVREARRIRMIVQFGSERPAG